MLRMQECKTDMEPETVRRNFCVFMEKRSAGHKYLLEQSNRVETGLYFWRLFLAELDRKCFFYTFTKIIVIIEKFITVNRIIFRIRIKIPIKSIEKCRRYTFHLLQYFISYAEETLHLPK